MPNHLSLVAQTSSRKALWLSVMLICGSIGFTKTTIAEEKPPSKAEAEAETGEEQQAKIQIFLLDGSIIVGDILEKEVKVTTPFGALTVPTTKIVGFRPGLGTQKERGAQITGYFKQLGDSDSKQRELASKAIIKLGLPVQPILKEKLKDADLDLRNRITIILKTFAEIESDADDDEDQTTQPLLRMEDVLTVATFDIHGKIEVKAFTVKSRFGTVKVQLSDIREAKRIEVKTEFGKRITVDGKYIAQKQFKSSGLRVEAGDQISVTAKGKITMTPWGSNKTSSPDGGANFNWYENNKIPGGCLVARIGSSGDIFKVGSKKTFTAKKSGTLLFAIGIPSSYVNYQYPGAYKLKIKVTPFHAP